MVWLCAPPPLGRKFVTLRVHPFAANNMSSPFEVLSEDDLLVVASLLPIPDVLRLSSTGQAVHATLMRSRQLWRTAAVALLGEPLVGLHRVAWKEKDCPRFYRRLLRAGRSSEHGLAYANKLRREVVATLPAATPLKSLICTTGHSATACGAGLVAVIGGWRAADPTPHLHCLVIDVVGRALRVPTLTQASASPVRRMRHASCAVRTPPWAALPAGAPAALPSVLVLGGACDGGGGDARREPPVGQERGDPVQGGLLKLTLLSFCDADGATVQWREASAMGSAPASIWHHQCASFAGGRRVC
jgi:hypothetical protein